MKHLLIAVYIFSVLYCYLKLNTMVDRCVEIFKERHPTIPMDAPTGWDGLKLTTELLGVSAIPVVNIVLGYFISTLEEPVISEVINNVEMKHWKEIRDAEKEINDRLNGNMKE